MKKGICLASAYTPVNTKSLDVITEKHVCAACEQQGQYILGDKGPLRTLGKVKYYILVLRCKCSFTNFVYVVFNDLLRHNNKNIVITQDAIIDASKQFLFPAYKEQELLLEATVADFKGNIEYAEKCINLCLQTAPNNAAAWYNLGELNTKTGDSDSALKAYYRCLELDPDFVSAAYKMAIIYKFLDNTTEAKKYLDKFIIKHPTHKAAIKLQQAIINDSIQLEK